MRPSQVRETKDGAFPEEIRYAQSMETQPAVVLVAEDDLLIREIVADFLSERGYLVVQVADAAQALEMIRESRCEIDLLFTDVRMPGTMNGMQLAELVSETWPTIKVLITSGHIRPTAAEVPKRSRFLPKPYTFDVLEESIALLFTNLDRNQPYQGRGGIVMA